MLNTKEIYNNLGIYAPSNRAPKYTKQKLTGLKEEIGHN